MNTRDISEVIENAQAPVVPRDRHDREDRALPRLDAADRDLSRITDAAWEALQAGNELPSLFRSGGAIVRIERDEAGQPVIRTVTEDRMRYTLGKVVRWYRRSRSGSDDPALPPGYVVKNVLATPDPPLPILDGIITAPAYAASGRLHSTPGYSSDTRLFYFRRHDLECLDIPHFPTAADVEWAKNLLLDDLMEEFPFTGDAERAHALTLLLQPFVRSMIDGPTPIYLVEKPTPGTGGTLLVNVLTFVFTGGVPTVMTEGKDDDEWRKRITAEIRGGSTVIFIDNLQRRLASPTLAAAISALQWKDRLLGKSDTGSWPVRNIWVATGNNPGVSNEIARRTIRIRLDTGMAQPWLRDRFRHPDLLRWAREQRSELVRAALTLIQSWIKGGAPPADCTLGTFESWAAVMGGILEAAEIPGFLGNLESFYQESDTESASWRAFLAAWWVEHQDHQVKVSQLHDIATQLDPPLELGTSSEQSQKSRLGKRLSRMRDRPFQLDDGTAVIVTAAGTFRRATLWQLRLAAPAGGGPVTSSSTPVSEAED